MSKGSIFTCQAAHSDNIKQVQFLPGTDDYVLSAGQDKEIKLWNLNLSDQDSPCTLKSSVKLNEAIENFCFIEEEGLIIVANGNLITLIAYD